MGMLSCLGEPRTGIGIGASSLVPDCAGLWVVVRNISPRDETAKLCMGAHMPSLPGGRPGASSGGRGHPPPRKSRRSEPWSPADLGAWVNPGHTQRRAPETQWKALGEPSTQLSLSFSTAPQEGPAERAHAAQQAGHPRPGRSFPDSYREIALFPAGGGRKGCGCDGLLDTFLPCRPDGTRRWREMGREHTDTHPG